MTVDGVSFRELGTKGAHLTALRETVEENLEAFNADSATAR